MKEELKPSEQLRNLADSLIEDIINTPDEEIMEEVGSAKEAERMRELIEDAKKTVNHRTDTRKERGE